MEKVRLLGAPAGGAGLEQPLSARTAPRAAARGTKRLIIDTNYFEAYNNRGNALTALVRLHEALTSYDLALAARPDYPEALNNRGSVLAAVDQVMVMADGRVQACGPKDEVLRRVLRPTAPLTVVGAEGGASS